MGTSTSAMAVVSVASDSRLSLPSVSGCGNPTLLTSRADLIARPKDADQKIGVEQGAPDTAAQDQISLLQGRYRLNAPGSSGRILGEGASSFVYRGEDTLTGAGVAVKVLKQGPGALRVFRKEVATLLAMREPFCIPTGSALWCSELDGVQPSDLFIRMLGCSRSINGQPGPDADACGLLYVIMELGDWTLKDHMDAQRKRGERFPLGTLRGLAHDILLAVAGLHAKGFIHLDVKPENFVMVGGRLKLIDVGGCLRTGALLGSSDLISYSPHYCAPEFARFVAGHASLRAAQNLDVWSVGVTLCELATLQSLFETRASRLGKGIDELGELECSLPESEIFTKPRGGKELKDLLAAGLLVGQCGSRSSLAQCLSHAFFVNHSASCVFM